MLTIEEKMPAEIVEKLEAMGHKIDRIDAGGVTQAIEVDAEGRLTGVFDPRIPGKAATGARPASAN